MVAVAALAVKQKTGFERQTFLDLGMVCRNFKLADWSKDGQL